MFRMLTALRKCKFLSLVVVVLLLMILQVSAEGMQDNKGFGSQQEIEDGDLFVYFIDDQQQVVFSPTVQFPLVEVSFQSQISATTLANSERRVRVDNATSHNIQLSLAPHLETGNFADDAKWFSGSRSYPIYSQNPGHGSLEVDPVNSSLFALGCDPSHVNLGSKTNFLFIAEDHEDNVESIDIFNSISGGMCRFDLEGVSLKQVIPAFQSPREYEYELEMVLTVTIAEIEDVFGCGKLFVDDRDEKQYNTVEIGDQCWMADNLNYQSTCSSVDWIDDSDEGWCGYYDDEGSLVEENGLLYQWSAAMDWDGEGSPPALRHEGICPEGWVVPSDEDWMGLEEALGMCSGTGTGCSETEGWRNSGDVGSKLAIWTNNGEGTNEAGFTALATGYRSASGSFESLGSSTGFWTSSSLESNSWRRLLEDAESGVSRELSNWAQAYPLRCVSDEIYTIKYASSNGGSVSPSSRKVAHKGTSLAPSIEANYNYDFLNFSIISGEGHGDLNSLTGEIVNVVGDMTVRANFIIKQYTISYTATVGGSIYPASRKVNHGSTAAAPSIGYIDPSYVFVGFSLESGEGNGIFESETAEITNVTGDMEILATFEPTPDPCGGATYYFDSRNGKGYPLVRIGEQCWMTKSLNYDDGCGSRSLPIWTDNRACRCYDNSTTNCDTYGRLYQYTAALGPDGLGDIPPSGQRQGLCPNGWLFASDEDWKQLEIFMGMSRLVADQTGWRNVGSVGTKLKAASTGSTPWDGTNTVNFNLPSGGAMWATPPFWGHPGQYEFRWLEERTDIRDSDNGRREFHTGQVGIRRSAGSVYDSQTAISLLYMRCVKTLD
jgi:uncharacterized protein (TIGR02145 family)